MHIVDGALAPSILALGGVVAIGGTALGLKKMDADHIPQVGLLSAAFFLASLIHVPIGPSSVHLILNGLVGLVLGWAAFPALLVGLLLQAAFFGFGGLIVLGVNVVNIALPAVLVAAALRPQLAAVQSQKQAFYWGVTGGALSILFTTLMVALSLFLSGNAFAITAKAVFWAHLPIMVLEGVLTGAAVVLIRRVKPELFHLKLRPSTEGVAKVSTHKNWIKTSLFLFMCLGFIYTPAWAHNMVADVYAEGMAVEGEVGFSSGDMVQGTTVTILNDQGQVLGKTQTNEEGIFTYQAKQVMDHHFYVDAGAGHIVKLILPADQLTGNPATSPVIIQPTQLPQPDPHAHHHNEELISGVGQQQLERLIETAVAKQVKPLRKQLLAYENKVRLQDALGGLGYIMGLVGLALWLSSRRKEPKA
ncbi:cobalt transporter CbiM [Magnetococcus sp. PR-3]|uniref:cobalt transporter CbiM n=1 Tax=Magnetococcus sp. PR-3 TaxID=3120355 RepID=UPI002FCE04E1